MSVFKVRRYNMAIWDGREPQTVVAATALLAAEKACGEPLRDVGTHGKLRAEVWAAAKPHGKETYYSIQ